MLDGEQKPGVAEYRFDLALGYEFDSNSIGKIGYAKLQEVMSVNKVVEIINNVKTSQEYDDEKESDYWNR
jgi:hypothetical protein